MFKMITYDIRIIMLMIVQIYKYQEQEHSDVL